MRIIMVVKKNPVVRAEEVLQEELDELILRAIDLAKGVLVQETVMEDGKPVERVYRMPPNPKVLMYVLDRVMGRPAQRIEMAGEGFMPVIIPLMPRERAIEEGLIAEEIAGELPAGQAAPVPD